MGYFGVHLHTDGAWRDDAAPGAPFLRVEIHDSDLAIVSFWSAGAAGLFYLGYQPRDYFDDPAASRAVDNDTETAAFVVWARVVLGVTLDAGAVRPLLADVGADEDPVDVFVEATLARLLQMLRLPLPSELADD
ncbi:hypothetical protein [Cellulomonas cellasea]|uniref:Uncharacterized protein n=1 Tax=Cellulomonas cellasea TaxID=43670 RepID=A0A4Y3KWE7_9CELL|nr:hypothetical protein [Cellulomonas cellasea]GEA88167.1 hypothetical protein CCE01nite_21160 [Cellulomonas cellasea]